MGVELTGEAEARRVAERQVPKKWEHLKTQSIVEALRTAKEMGWKEHKVQVRFVTEDELTYYYVEPFEDGCGCRGILKYSEYFD